MNTTSLVGKPLNRNASGGTAVIDRGLMRPLGAAFLLVVLTSLVSGLATDRATGAVDVPLTTVFGHLADHAGTLHLAVLFGLLNAVGILALAGLLHGVLAPFGRVVALIGVLCWAGEALVYATNQLTAGALLSLASTSQSSDGAASLGRTLLDVHRAGGTMLMFFYCAGGLAFYSLFLTSRLVPRWLALYGLLAVTVGLAGGVVELLGHPLGLLPYIAIGPFEILTGLYLLIRRGAAARALD